MKIKCPACSKVLNIPDSAAGKVVKCPCGKQLRAPGGGGPASPATKPNPAARPNPTAKPNPTARPAGRPAASTPAASGMGGFDAGMLDELTDQDLAPVKSVSMPGRAPAAKPSRASAALEEAVSGQDRRGEALIHQGLAPRPPFLMFLGIVNAFWSIMYFGLALLMLGIVAMIPAVADEVPEAAGAVFAIIMFGLVFMGILCIATAVCCFTRGRFPWYVLVFSYSYGFADRIFGVIGEVMAEEIGGGIVGSILGIVVGFFLWAYMHGDDVRAFFGTEGETIGKIIAINAAGLIVGGGISGAVIFLAQ